MRRIIISRRVFAIFCLTVAQELAFSVGMVDPEEALSVSCWLSDKLSELSECTLLIDRCFKVSEHSSSVVCSSARSLSSRTLKAADPVDLSTIIKFSLGAASGAWIWLPEQWLCFGWLGYTCQAGRNRLSHALFAE